MRQFLVFLVLFSGMAILGRPCSSLLAQVSRAEPNLCNVTQLPAEIQNRIRTGFGTWRVQAPENLSQQARLSWAGKKSSGCPGIAVGQFVSPKHTSYAVLLVPSDHPDAAYRFVVFDPQAESSAYVELVVEKSDAHGASNFFIQMVPISKFFDETSKKKFHVQAIEGILMVDSANKEYEADIYFWSEDRFRQEPVDY
jgi:hypothetical protein